eukprot:TRINITY_DN3769_c1_g2_i1.p3 TRINITY_DN3769_c1_g2~~TRINITY_DN3769_c1_g2_i1.p3  ORF type:complete len:199 (-),score=3.89 TRINITY_DN3769_c1_g2_i1:161-757(-)
MQSKFVDQFCYNFQVTKFCFCFDSQTRKIYIYSDCIFCHYNKVVFSIPQDTQFSGILIFACCEIFLRLLKLKSQTFRFLEFSQEFWRIPENIIHEFSRVLANFAHSRKYNTGIFQTAKFAKIQHYENQVSYGTSLHEQIFIQVSSLLELHDGIFFEMFLGYLQNFGYKRRDYLFVNNQQLTCQIFLKKYKMVQKLMLF